VSGMHTPTSLDEGRGRRSRSHDASDMAAHLWGFDVVSGVVSWALSQ
jgi:hypothetical protein